MAPSAFDIANRLKKIKALTLLPSYINKIALVKRQFVLLFAAVKKFVLTDLWPLNSAKLNGRNCKEIDYFLIQHYLF